MERTDVKVYVFVAPYPIIVLITETGVDESALDKEWKRWLNMFKKPYMGKLRNGDLAPEILRDAFLYALARSGKTVP